VLVACYAAGQQQTGVAAFAALPVWTG
jgi:hypothetical protein